MQVGRRQDMHAVDPRFRKHLRQRIEGKRDVPGAGKSLRPPEIGIARRGQLHAVGFADRARVKLGDIAGSDNGRANGGRGTDGHASVD
jgi:hypothetical protein